MANRKAMSQFFYSFHVANWWIDVAFMVNPAVGAGINGFSGPGVKNVFMHTTTTPAAGSPNPASGLIWLQLQDNYSRYYAAMVDFVSPLSGTNIAVTAAGAHLTVGNAYTITVLGTTTAANWVTLGVPVGVTPAVGVSFIAAVTGAGTGSGQVQVSTNSGISAVELIQDPNMTLQLANSNQNGGGILIWQCLAPTNSSTTTPIVTAPATGSICRIKLLLSNSSQTVQGE